MVEMYVRRRGDGMANRDIVAIGTSAGGVEALLSLTKGLPRNLPASILLTIHVRGARLRCLTMPDYYAQCWVSACAF